MKNDPSLPSEPDEMFDAYDGPLPDAPPLDPDRAIPPDQLPLPPLPAVVKKLPIHVWMEGRARQDLFRFLTRQALMLSLGRKDALGEAVWDFLDQLEGTKDGLVPVHPRVTYKGVLVDSRQVADFVRRCRLLGMTERDLGKGPRRRPGPGHSYRLEVYLAYLEVALRHPLPRAGAFNYNFAKCVRSAGLPVIGILSPSREIITCRAGGKMSKGDRVRDGEYLRTPEDGKIIRDLGPMQGLKFWYNRGNFPSLEGDPLRGKKERRLDMTKKELIESVGDLMGQID